MPVSTSSLAAARTIDDFSTRLGEDRYSNKYTRRSGTDALSRLRLVAMERIIGQLNWN